MPNENSQYTVSSLMAKLALCIALCAILATYQLMGSQALFAQQATFPENNKSESRKEPDEGPSILTLLMNVHDRLRGVVIARNDESADSAGADIDAKLMLLKKGLLNHPSRNKLAGHQNALVEETIALIDARVAGIRASVSTSKTADETLDKHLEERIRQHPAYELVAQLNGNVRNELTAVTSKSQAIATAYIALLELSPKLQDTMRNYTKGRGQFLELVKMIEDLRAQPAQVVLSGEERKGIEEYAVDPANKSLAEQFTKAPEFQESRYPQVIRWCETQVILWQALLKKEKSHLGSRLTDKANPASVSAAKNILRQEINMTPDKRSAIQTAWEAIDKAVRGGSAPTP